MNSILRIHTFHRRRHLPQRHTEYLVVVIVIIDEEAGYFLCHSLISFWLL